MNLTVEQILAGTTLGRMQSVGQMDVIPVLSDEDDETYAPPNVTVGTNHYGTVDIQNREDRPTIVPTGAGWVTRQSAQDHAVPSAALIAGKGSRKIETAMCIEQSQGGYITGAQDFMILPAQLRTVALSKRKERSYSKLWDAISQLNSSFGINRGDGHLVYFLDAFEKELDEFVAEFELVPRQVGSIVLIGGKVVGIERAPSVEFWDRIWEPLIRVCYGSLALKVQRQLGDTPPPTRSLMDVKVKTLAGILDALNTVQAQTAALTDQIFQAVAQKVLQPAGTPEEQMGAAHLLTLASPDFAGQVVLKDRTKYPYVSLCASGA